MAEIILITGGARSGKSSYALNYAEGIFDKKIFIATAVSMDPEMKSRIEKHKKERSPDFKTIEEPYSLDNVVDCLDSQEKLFIILDCVTVWLGNLFYKYNSSQEKIEMEIDSLIKALGRYVAEGKGRFIIITNELGNGIVPENKMAREFRDTAGYLNQALAKKADKVYLCVSGIPVKIK